MSTPTPGHIILLGSNAVGDETVSGMLRARDLPVTAFADPEAGLARAADAPLIIIDHADGREGAALCARIRGTPGLADKVILCLVSSEGVEERVRFLEAGADDVISRPFDARELDARVDTLLARVQREVLPGDPQPGPATDVPRLVGFYGPKGGSGTSTLATNVAVALAVRGGRRVALVDLDLQWGDVAALLDLTIRQTVAELARDSVALADTESVEAYAASHHSGLAVFGAPPRPDEAESVSAEHIGQLLVGLRDAYDLVIVDTGSAFDDRTITVLEHVDRLVVPVIPEIPALRAVRTLLEVLAELERGSAGVIPVLVHRQERELLQRAEMEEALGVSVATEVPFDAALFHAAANAGEAIVTGAPRSAAAASLEALAVRVVGDAPPAGPGGEALDRRQRLRSLLKRGVSSPGA